MIDKRAKQEIGQRLLARFREAGASEVAPDILLPADALLDLYGEDIRARAYVSTDPIRGEVMLRPDFTVPVVQTHMETGAEPARYCYLGEVFRKQDTGDTRPEKPRDNEYLQAGFEHFTRDSAASAELFSLFHKILTPYGARATMGDMALLMQAVIALPLSQPRQSALLHHIWRPKRFSKLITRFTKPVARRDFVDSNATWAGKRSPSEMEARIARLNADANETPLPQADADRLEALFRIKAPLPAAIEQIGYIADEMPQIKPQRDRIAARAETLKKLGIAPETVIFDASHGRETMEYYDGFTFSFDHPNHTDWPPLAQGGRYDALTAEMARAAGRVSGIPAVGGIIRPGLLAELEANQ